jgi:hypothetical protein
MSIADSIRWHVAEGRLFPVRPKAYGSIERRMMFVSQELNEILVSEAPSLADVARIAVLDAQLGHFVEGGVVDPTYMRMLDRPAHNVLEIRARRPRPSIRVFGRFAQKDVFIALNVELRNSLAGKGSRAWRDEAVRCGVLWRALFPTYDPLEGDSLHDFISENVYDRRELGL